MNLKMTEIALLCGVSTENIDPDLVTGYSTDSRTIRKGDLFVPLIAERDGHDFISAALEAGAVGYLYSHGQPNKKGIHVNDTLAALQRLAVEAHNRLDAKTIGITGSVGKTTTKDMLHSCLSDECSTWASSGSFNNEIGVPLTILSAPVGTDFLIVEMGARGVGHIHQLCLIAKPNVGVVTCIGNAHSEFFGGISQTIDAKGELIESLEKDDLAVLNYDDPNVRELGTRTSAEVLLYGIGGGEVVAENIALDSELKASFDLCTPWGNSAIRLNIPGKHNITNALAAAATAMHSKVSIAAVASALESVEISPLRMEIFESASGTLVINDAYNANLLSMKAALSALATSGRKHLVAVLGVMAELGDDHISSHKEIGKIAKSNDIDVISVNVKEYGGQVVKNIDEAYHALENKVNDPQSTAVLLKGSRVVALENLAKKIT